MDDTKPAQPPLGGEFAAAAMWIGAFLFSSSVFLTLTKLLENLPATPPIAVGRVTIDGVSKMQDYVTAALFFLVVPLLTVLLQRVWQRYTTSLRGRAGSDPTLATLAATIPLIFAPLFYLTTGKVGWGTILPLVLAAGICEAWAYGRSHRWPRVLLESRLRIWHFVAVIEAVSWILYRYIATGKRIAHIPTLFLEVVFFFFFVALFWFLLVFISLLKAVHTRTQSPETFPGVVTAFLPLFLLPLLALTALPSGIAVSVVLITIVILLFVPERTCSNERPCATHPAGSPGALNPGAAPSELRAHCRAPLRIGNARLRSGLLLIVAPLLLFVFSYSSVASLSQWVDLFHRGETLGPASEYLRGEAPYREVFVLHGMLEDGLLDAFLMKVFGRDAQISATRAEVLSSMMAPALWFLGLAATRNGVAALGFVFLGFFTAADNQRGLFEIVIVALLLVALQRGSRATAFLAAAFTALTLFFSLEIGLYSIGGSVISLVLVRKGWRLLPWWIGGFAAGAVPFLLYLSVHGSLAQFFTTSFVLVPRIIDPTWSLPFPDLVAPFRGDLTVRTFTDFFLGDRFRFILNPLVIGIALVLVIASMVRRRSVDVPLLTLTAFALLTQRSALGRADFPHQYFSAFLIAPLAVMLLVRLVSRLRDLWGSNESSRAAILILAAVAAPLLAIAFWIPDLLNSRLDNAIGYRQRLLAADWSDEAGRKVAERIGAIRHDIQKTLKPNDPMFDFSNQPALYFFADRPNPTRFFQVPILSPRELQREAIRDLEKTRTRLVLRRSPEDFDGFDGISNDARAAALSAYIDANYRFARSVRGVEFWLRAPAGEAFSEEKYLKRIIPPGQVKESLTSRVIFPAVGSLRGASGNEWRSELVVHNSDANPVSLELRYLVPNQPARERSLRVEPETTVKIDDVALLLFGAAETRGMLIVEHPRSTLPTMRLRTFDAARNSESTLEEPLAVSDAGRAGADRLIIIGARGGWLRRVNIGIVNAGNGPARARITMRTPAGAIVGVPVDVSIEENGSSLTVHAEAVVGAPISPNTPLHIQILEGAVWAFAASIDGESGHQQVVRATRVPQR